MNESSTYLYWTVMFSIKITVNKYTYIIKQIHGVLSFIWHYTITLRNHTHGRRLYVHHWRKKTKKHIWYSFNAVIETKNTYITFWFPFWTDSHLKADTYTETQHRFIYDYFTLILWTLCIWESKRNTEEIKKGYSTERKVLHVLLHFAQRNARNQALSMIALHNHGQCIWRKVYSNE